MKNLKSIIALVFFASILISCNNRRERQLQYMPDMYESVPYDANGANGINNAPVNIKPVAGTISRGGHPAYDIPDTPEGYDKAKAELTNPLALNDENLEKGKQLYDIYCISCHGKKGDGNGPMVESGAYAGVPDYKNVIATEGQMFYSIYYGKGAMGGHSSILDKNEIWTLVHYVRKFQDSNYGTSNVEVAAVADTTK